MFGKIKDKQERRERKDEVRETIQEVEEIPIAGKKEMWGKEENGSQKRMRGEVKSVSEMKIVIIIIMIRNEKKKFIRNQIF